MHYPCEWVKVREYANVCCNWGDCCFYEFGRNGYDKTKRKEGKTYVSTHHMAYPLKVTIINYSHGKPWAVTVINPNLGPKWWVGLKVTKEDWRMRAGIIITRQRERSIPPQTITNGDRLLKKRKRQSKMKTKADTPVPRCIASLQLQSWSWWFRKAHGHLALVALLGKG